MPLLPAALLLSTLLLPLVSPSRVLMVRDVSFFHLPLRQAVAALVHRGELPEWNAGIHGGQPILSNPNYAAFYPPSWLALIVPVAWALGLLVILHAAWALAGAWRLLRQLGAAADAAALGAMGFAASSWFLSLTSTFNFYCAMAWFPWIVAAAESAFAAERETGDAARADAGRWGGAALFAGAGLAMQLLAGEPVAVLVSGLALVGLAAGRWRRLRRTLPRLAAIALLAAAFGAVQLVPTMHRLAGTARSGLSSEEAGRWSTPPARLVDLVLPRFWGDSGRDEEGLWFGWGLHDRDFPYVVALYSGLLLTALAAAALLRGPIPYRGAWAFAMGAGVLLALGRHDPLWEPLRRFVPLLGVVRFPEKFVVLAAAVVPIAGALGWQHLLDARDRGERGWAFLPAALAGIVAAVAATFAGVLAARAGVGAQFIRDHSGLPPSPRTVEAGLAFLRREAWVALLLALAVTLLLLLLAMGRASRRTLAGAALLLLAVDLWWYGRGLEPTLPTTQVSAAPAAVATARALGGRVFSGPAFDHQPEIGVRQGPPGFQQLWARLQRLDPYAGTLWGVQYALDPDYDLMLTPWARHAQAQLAAAWPRRGEVNRLLGGWDVGALVLRREMSDQLRELRATGKPPHTFALLPLAERLPRYRFVRTISHVENAAAAASELPQLDLANADVCVGDGEVAPRGYAAATLLAHDEGQRVRLRYRAAGAAFLVAAITFDDGWQATLDDGPPAATCPTALGQLGVALPAGEHALLLRYRDPWVRGGAAITAIALLGAALVASRRRRPPVESAA
ncbi:MAG TPA: hypothetical protein VGS57_06010 [Thermoanaerobaculia bacterium]|nr:hypothetical protein [Thermoanaerobaculia bacterium]